MIADFHFRALCAELLDALEIQLDELRFDNRLCKRARAALSDPEQGPTDEQILAIQDQVVASFPPIHPEAQNLSAIEYSRVLEIRKARAVLQLAGHPAVEPVSVIEWHGDIGNVLWWRFPIEEPPYVGSPLDTDWPGYHTHFTLLPLPQEGTDA